MKTWLALGDSYTIGQSVDMTKRYPVQTTELLRKKTIAINDAEIIATTGWTTSDLWSAVKDKTIAKPYDVVTLLIGVNNQYRGGGLEDYRSEFTQLLVKSIQLAGGKPNKVVVISIPDYSVTPFARSSDPVKISKEIDQFNNISKQISNDYNVGYLYITDDSRKAAADPGLIAGDSLHFSGREYAIWSAKLAPMIKKLFE